MKKYLSKKYHKKIKQMSNLVKMMCILLKSLRCPNTVFASALADAIQRVHKDHKNKHAVDSAIISICQCPLYLCYFPS